MKLRMPAIRRTHKPKVMEPGPAWIAAPDGIRRSVCPLCGQKRLEREDMSFRHLIGESFLDYFHFDSKFFRTIVPLVLKPGKLSLEFMKGKRKSYVEPFRLFLVISIIYFLLLPFSKENDEPRAKNLSIDTKGMHLKKPMNSRRRASPSRICLWARRGRIRQKRKWQPWS